MSNINDLIGSTLSAKQLFDTDKYVKQSHQLAESHDWLYHCTKAEVLINMIKSGEMWLSNLNIVNDREEPGRIDAKEYEKSIFIACFTYDPDIPPEHWKEYGSESEGILVAFKKSDFLREVHLLDTNNKHINGEFYQVCCCEKAAQDKCNINGDNPYYIGDFGFYQVIYDNNLKLYVNGRAEIRLDSLVIQGRTKAPNAIGLVKSTHGICERPGYEAYEKDWVSEKEIRLRVRVQQLINIRNGDPIHDGKINDVWFKKIAVPFSSEVFKHLRIRLSPKFENEESLIQRLNHLLPNTIIELF